jgi:hypothetical protein
MHMGYRFTFEIVLSEAAAAAVGKYKMDISTIACDAVFEAVAAKIESEKALEFKRNAELREQVRELQETLQIMHRIHRRGPFILK